MIWRCLVVLVLGAGGAHAAPDPKQTITSAQKMYDQGRFQDALPLLDELSRNKTLAKPDKIRALKLKAFALYMVSLPDDAKSAWLELLVVEPTYKLDPLEDSPVFISFFERIKPEVKTPPGQTPPDNTPPAATEPPPPAVLLPPPTVLPKPASCKVALCLVPFGVGQFANDDPAKGVAFGVFELGFLGTNILMQILRDREFDQTRGAIDEKEESRRVVIQNVALGLFVGTIVGGVVEAFISAD